MNCFNFLFYKSYKISLFLGNEDFYPEIKAWFLTILFPWLNILSLLIILENELIISNEVFRFILFSTSFFWIASYIYYIINRNYVKVLLVQEKSNIKYGNLWFAIYTISTFIIYFGFVSN